MEKTIYADKHFNVATKTSVYSSFGNMVDSNSKKSLYSS